MNDDPSVASDDTSAVNDDTSAVNDDTSAVNDDTSAVNDDPHEHLARDDALAPLVADYGPFSLDPAEDLFARLVTSICNQQVSAAAAQTIRDRVFDAVRVTPEGVREADPDRLREAGLSAQKVRYVRAAADRFAAEGWTRETFAGETDDAVRARLTEIPGVGAWTADVTLVFGLGREDVFPVGDLAVRRAAGHRTGIDPDDRAALRERAQRWSPYRSYAACYLWHDYEDGDTTVG